jgi:hypothetical protein
VEQLVIVIIIGAVSLIKWLMEKSAEARAAREIAERIGDPTPDEPNVAPPRPAPPMQAPRPSAYPISDFETAARRLREALGLPEESELPRPVERRAEPPVAPRKEPVILFERPLPDLRMAPPIERAFEPLPEPPPYVEPQPAPRKSTADKTAGAGLDELLRSRDGLRKAILMSEILGTPKGLVF